MMRVMQVRVWSLVFVAIGVVSILATIIQLVSAPLFPHPGDETQPDCLDLLDALWLSLRQCQSEPVCRATRRAVSASSRSV